MRQAGVIAAGGLYALKHNIDRLKVDHEHARSLEETLKSRSWVKEVIPVETNIVVAVLNDHDLRDKVIDKLAEKGIRIMAFGPGMLRFVTHLDISGYDIDRTQDALESLSF